MTTTRAFNQAFRLLEIVKEKDSSHDQLQRIYDSGLLGDLLDANIEKVTPEVRDQIRRLFGLRPLQKRLVEKPISLLTKVGTGSLPAVAKFVATEHFKPEVVGINFWFGKGFERFLCKVEHDVPARTLAIHNLNRETMSGSIREELTPEREEIALAHLYIIIARQSKGEQGMLPTDGTTSIAFIKDGEGGLGAVFLSRDKIHCQWRVSALSFSSHCPPWDRGDQVLSQF